MATKKYKATIIHLLPTNKKWLNKTAKKLSKEWGRYVSMSEVVRFMVDAHQDIKK